MNGIRIKPISGPGRRGHSVLFLGCYELLEASIWQNTFRAQRVGLPGGNRDQKKESYQVEEADSKQKPHIPRKVVHW
jgi:hypothetical protein